MSLPPLNAFATDAYAYLEPIAWADEANGYPLATLIGALGNAFDQVEAISRAQPGRQPYQQVYDIEQCPDDRVPGLLGWLGQLVGVAWVPYSDSDAKRTEVLMEPQFYRGSISVLTAAIIATQIPPGRVTILERDSDAWSVVVAYDPIFTPDPAATEAAATENLPWGLALNFNSVSVPIFEEGTLTFEAVASTVTFESAVLADVI